MRLDIGALGVRRGVAAMVGLVALVLAVTGPVGGQSPPTAESLDIVVTTPILGSVVSDLVGDRATVTVLMAEGTDPHEWAPSAQDLETIYGADLVVANGLDLEEGLHDALDEAQANGVPVFEATDHIAVRSVGEETVDPAASASAAPGAGDPHFWVDPLSMVAVVEALAPALAELGLDVSDRGTDLVTRLQALDEEVRGRLAVIPAASRTLVTGHESMGYFAARYDLRLIGAIIPGLSSQGEVSAWAMADLAERIREAGVTVIFAEVGTPRFVADAIAGETGATIVELPSHRLPADGSYSTFITDIADAVAEALS